MRARGIKKNQAAHIEPNLPPAGDERKEVLARRKDELDELAEELANDVEAGKIDPTKYQPINEILQHLDSSEVTGRLPEYEYHWQFTGRSGYFIRKAQIEGWEVVQGDNPEAKELKGIGADTTRRWGDCILMRIRKDLALRNLRKDRARRRMQQEGVTETLAEYQDKLRQYGIIVHTEASGEMMNRMQQRAAARQVAGQALGNMLKSESGVPGLPLPGRK